jgi:uncharacterized membrane protein YoaK (UPF0700 family)
MSMLGAMIGVSLLMTIMFGDMLHWIPIALVVLVSLKVVQHHRR